jgi:hypothetical protein
MIFTSLFIDLLITPRLMGRKRDWAFAREKLNDDFAKHKASRLLRSNGAG